MFLEHVNLTVSDLEQSIAFYSQLFDFRLRWRGSLTDGRPAAHVGTEKQYIALFQGKQPGPSNSYTETGVNHFGMVVDDIEAMAERLRKLGVVPTDTQDYEPGKRLYFFDHDGVEVELVQY